MISEIIKVEAIMYADQLACLIIMRASFSVSRRAGILETCYSE